jgi:hypothetical protein
MFRAHFHIYKGDKTAMHTVSDRRALQDSSEFPVTPVAKWKSLEVYENVILYVKYQRQWQKCKGYLEFPTSVFEDYKAYKKSKYNNKWMLQPTHYVL